MLNKMFLGVLIFTFALLPGCEGGFNSGDPDSNGSDEGDYNSGDPDSNGSDEGDDPQQFVFREDWDGYSGTCNTMMKDTNPDHEYGGGVFMDIGYWGNSPDEETSRALLKFDLSSIPEDAEIVSATLRLVFNNRMAIQADYVIQLEIHTPEKQWVETEATWNNATDSVSWDSGGGDYSGPVGTVNIPINEYGPDDAIDISLDAAVVQQWVATPTENRGMLFKTTSENTTDDNERNKVTFYTSYRGTEADRPRLIVEANL